jgi:hypothetical protein
VVSHLGTPFGEGAKSRGGTRVFKMRRKSKKRIAKLHIKKKSKMT